MYLEMFNNGSKSFWNIINLQISEDKYTVIVRRLPRTKGTLRESWEEHQQKTARARNYN